MTEDQGAAGSPPVDLALRLTAVALLLRPMGPWYVAPVIPLGHSDPEAYAEPTEFRPERFLIDKPPMDAWIPFGGSRRMCLGIQLALLEMKVALREILNNVDIKAVDPAPERPRLRGITIAPEHQATVVANR